ncbi:MAG: phytoene dehydrogenase [Bdellovibrionales bacterium CG12_big_fil_rev_8_21_14_0_65_38_15]|nr:MAG: phytoene dehydrogenase [Bdellovibrionales bacterium CG22_combo_CG10-13_8_21_14_all_38_13]PIQ55324.1 MAG: phytoene dehydrogenase [Bdellovibrionales bacterium CG12_big_fil_rev_8_21_14_0_65_38_15]PIR28934.1 MAG: phytoene dehydrogenase [Bdellovibrionales bacterium CG11_big_fil_rev_8_21_14_0_20_38_13]
MEFKTSYDAIVVGAGMSGMAAAIRLAMFDRKVLLIEKHSIPGGLNSFYRRANRNLDVGLHALTNAVPKGTRGAPLTKLLKQLRIPYENLKLCPQTYSLIRFPEKTLSFSNDFNEFDELIKTTFPEQFSGWTNFVTAIKDFDETNLQNEYFSAKEKANEFLSDPLLIEMVFSPLMIYGSAWEHDMDWSQFVIMFKSIYLEGLGRPVGGVRTIIKLLTDKLKELNVDLRYSCELQSIESVDGKVSTVLLKDRKLGELSIQTQQVFSSIGLPETMDKTNHKEANIRAGNMSFTESIFFLKEKPRELGQNATLIFHNNRDQYLYQKPKTLIDDQSAVICLPNNYHDDNEFEEGIVRVTFMANNELWTNLSEEDYKAQKEIVSQKAKALVSTYFEKEATFIFDDTFTPKTVTRYTSHYAGAVYGSPDKTRDGKTAIDGLYITGTDQGFLGIVGAMLSGISMANYHGLQGGAQ